MGPTIFASNKLIPELLNAETALNAPSHLSSHQHFPTLFLKHQNSPRINPIPFRNSTLMIRHIRA
jgi:hypothetical protein